MSDTPGPDLGLSEATAAALPTVPAGWTAYPSLGGGFGAKKFFPSVGRYEDVVTHDPDLLNDLATAADEKYAPEAPAVDEFEQAVEEPAEAPASDELVAPVPAEESAPADNSDAAEPAEGADTTETGEQPVS